jgi:predicted Zn-dependent protease
VGVRVPVRTPQETAERAVAMCRADGCVVIVTEESEANIRWANSSLTTDGVTSSRRVTVVATVDSAAGTSAGVVSRRGAVDDTLPDLVAAAEQAARAAAPAEDAQPLVTGDGPGTGWSEPVPQTSMAAFAGLAPALGEAFAVARWRGQLLYGYAQHRASSTFLASSSGLRLRTDESSGHIELTGKSADRRRSAWAGVAGDLSEAAVAGLYAQIDQRLGWAQRQVDLPPGRYETVLPPAAVADLMNYVYWSAGAREAAEGRTVYSAPDGGTRIGERLTERPLSLRGDPSAPGLECSPFVLAAGSDGIVSVFDNGLPLRPTAWIDNGVLAALLQTRHSAALTGMPLTPHIDNLVLEGAGATATLADLIAGTERGLLLTTLWYIREVDLSTLLLTGLTRDGVYLVERGEVAGAVNNFRFNESPVHLLGRVLDVGRTEPTRAREWGGAFTHCAMPPLRVADFNMSSVSQAV